MSLPTAIVAVAALSTPDACLEARDLAETIARARDARVPIVAVFESVKYDPLWVQIAGVTYGHPSIPPVAIGAMVESACRDSQ